MGSHTAGVYNCGIDNAGEGNAVVVGGGGDVDEFDAGAQAEERHCVVFRCDDTIQESRLGLLGAAVPHGFVSVSCPNCTPGASHADRGLVAEDTHSMERGRMKNGWRDERSYLAAAVQSECTPGSSVRLDYVSNKAEINRGKTATLRV